MSDDTAALAGPARAPEAMGDEDIVATVLRLDANGMFDAIASYLAEHEFQFHAMLLVLYHLMAGGRFRASHIVARHVADQGAGHPIVELARGIGAAIAGDGEEFNRASFELMLWMQSTGTDKLFFFREQVAGPALSQATGPAIAGQSRALEAKLLRLKQIVFPHTVVPAEFVGGGAVQLRSLLHPAFNQRSICGVLKGRYARMGDGCMFYDLDNKTIVTPLPEDDWAFGAYTVNIGKLDHRTIHARHLAKLDKRLTNGAIIVTPYANNYFHVTLECFSGLRLIDHHRIGMGEKVIGIGAELTQRPWQRELMTKCVAGRPMNILDGTEMLIDPVIILTTVSTDAVDYIRGRIDRFGAPGPDTVLIDRSGPTTRLTATGEPDTNAGMFAETPAWTRMIERFGIRRVNFGTGELTVSEQIARLDGARTVIATHGSSMTNLIYMNPPLNVIELASSTMSTRPVFAEISEHLGFNYALLVGDQTDESGRTVVDTEQLSDLIYSARRWSGAR